MAYGFGDLYNSVKTYGGYALDPVGIVTGKKASWAPDPAGLSSDPSAQPKIDDTAAKAFAAQALANTPMAYGGIDPSVTANAASGLIGSYQGTINGQTPSIAMEALRQQTGQNTANAFGNAASGVTGGNALLALRHASDQASDLNQHAAGQAAMLRAQEIAQAQQGLSGAVGQQLGAQNQQRQLALEAFKAPLDASAKEAAAQYAKQGALLESGGKILGSIL